MPKINCYRGTAVIIFFALCKCSSVFAQISIDVSKAYSEIIFAYDGEIPPKDLLSSNFPSTSNDDRYFALIRPAGKLKVLLLDGKNVESKSLEPTPIFDRVVEYEQFLEFPPLPPSGWFIFSNLSNSVVEASITIYRIGGRSPEAVSRIRELVEAPLQALDLMYELPKFNVYVKPCGKVNAYSSPDIVICTELIADLVQKNLMDAFYSIFLHEVGHSLLFLWGLPGYNNEDFVDEFAASMLATSSPSSVGAYIKWLESHDLKTDAVVQLIAGDRHTVSLQRAKNMQYVLDNKTKVLDRWGRLLMPYSKLNK